MNEPREYKLRNPKQLVELPNAEEITKSMRCVMCSRYVLDGGLACASNHTICKICVRKEGFSQSPQCPLAENPGEIKLITCGQDIKEFNFGPFKELFLKSKFKCPNKECNVVLLGEDFYSHVKTCELRATITCKFTGCKQPNAIIVSKYIHHLQTFHKVPVYFAESVKNYKILHPFCRPTKTVYPNIWIAAIMRTSEGDFVIIIEETEKSYTFRGFHLDDREQNKNKHAQFNFRIELTDKDKDQENVLSYFMDQVTLEQRLSKRAASEYNGKGWCGRVLPLFEIDEEDEDFLERDPCKLRDSCFCVGKGYIYDKILLEMDYFIIDIRIELAPVQRDFGLLPFSVPPLIGFKSI